MAEIRTVTTLRRKRDEVRKAVRNYEKRLDQARSDLAHMTAAIAIFEAKDGDESLPSYSDLQRLFRYGEAFKICQQALASGPKTTRELAVYVAKAGQPVMPAKTNVKNPTKNPSLSFIRATAEGTKPVTPQTAFMRLGR